MFITHSSGDDSHVPGGGGVLAWRQINHMVEEEDMVVMIDKKGKTDLKILNKVLKDEKKVFT